jgi:hypothetical protein
MAALILRIRVQEKGTFTILQGNEVYLLLSLKEPVQPVTDVPISGSHVTEILHSPLLILIKSVEPNQATQSCWK